MKIGKFAAAAAWAGAMVLAAVAGPAGSAQRSAPPAAVAAAVPEKPSPSEPVAAVTPGPATRPLERADLEAWLDGVVPYALKDADLAGVVVVVVKDGAVLLEKGYGYADVAAKRPMDPQTSLLRPGSTSKLFTWTAVMQLVEQGKINLDADVNTYLDFKVPQKFGKPITMRDLMNHRAGFEEGLKDVLATDPKKAQSTEVYLKTHPRPMLFAPGQVPAYSNYGVALAGYIVQRVSGEPFEQYVERHIFKPLGMNSSTFAQPVPKAFEPNLAKGYRTASGPAFPFEMIITAPAGSLTATGSDMARFMIANLQQGRYGSGQILSPQTMQQMHSPSQTNLPGFATMAHGFFHDTRNGRTFIGHGGDTIVHHTEMNLIPSEGVGIFFSFNSRGANDGVYAARANLFDGFMDRYFAGPPEPKAPTLASAKQDAKEIAGLYRSSRRIEHGFIAFFYMLQQTTISANADGTISAPNGVGTGLSTLREVGPQIWQEVDGDRRLALRTIGGVKTVIDSHDPTSVMQATPFINSSTLNVTVLLASFAVLLLTALLWPLTSFLRWTERAPSGLDAGVRRLRLYDRGVAIVSLVYLFCWYLLMQPILVTQLDVYSSSMDLVVRAIQVFGLVIIALAGVALWVAYRMFKLKAPWPTRVWGVAVALAMLGLVWIGVMGKLMSFTLNY